MKAAREIASYLVETMGQELGEVIRIVEPVDNNISRYLPFQAQSNVSMGTAATEQYRVIGFDKQSVFLTQVVLSFALG